MRYGNFMASVYTFVDDSKTRILLGVYALPRVHDKANFHGANVNVYDKVKRPNRVVQSKIFLVL